MNKRVIIFGATSDIGIEIIKTLQLAKCDIALVGRNEEKLNRIKNELTETSCKIYVHELSDIDQLNVLFKNVSADGILQHMVWVRRRTWRSSLKSCFKRTYRHIITYQF